MITPNLFIKKIKETIIFAHYSTQKHINVQLLPTFLLLLQRIYKISARKLIYTYLYIFMKRILSIAIISLTAQAAMAQDIINIELVNNSKADRKDVPYVVSLSDKDIDVKSALVTIDGKEIPSQLDDLDNDGTFDELAFTTDIPRKTKLTASIELSDNGEPRHYAAKTHAQMILRNSKVKIKNKHDIFLRELSVTGNSNPFQIVHHHGPAFESELVAYRLYFDKRQTMDLYGKFKKQLEIAQTQFYPDSTQKANGYGDDVLWVGNTFGLGAVRGWDGNEPRMLDDLKYRTMRIVAQGPVRAIVEIVDQDWNTYNVNNDNPRVTMTTRYTIYAGHRDTQVDLFFRKPAKGIELATGIINVKGSEEYSNHKGLRGCWGTDWPVALKDSAGHKPETVGLGIYIPSKNIVSELPANKDNYPFVIGNFDTHIRYYITFASDNETFGFHSKSEWFEYLEQWAKEINMIAQ